MASTIPVHNIPQQVCLDGSLLQPRAAEILHELRAALGEHVRVQCDLSTVDSIDLTGIQLLLAARVSLVAKGGTLSFNNLSAPVRELCAALGVELENG